MIWILGIPMVVVGIMLLVLVLAVAGALRLCAHAIVGITKWWLTLPGRSTR